ncbi:MAG: tRNA (adenosine(37)-N6)-threonylcarbamoyltransferase complex dimerization subunit type 1 TsaB [Bacteroidota bacterium]
MPLLALETATDVCSVALVDGDARVTGLAETLEPRSHAARLVPLIQELLAEHGFAPSDLDAVAVSAGPGSYTGLRIGASTAKGLAWVTGADLVAVPSLEALAFGALGRIAEGDLLVAAFRSRRGEVYAAAFGRSGDSLSTLVPAEAVLLDALAAWLPGTEGTRWVAGEAGALAAEALPTETRVLDPAAVRPSAALVGVLGVRRLAAGQTEDVAAFEPDYLKAFVAKRGSSIFDRLPK